MTADVYIQDCDFFLSYMYIWFKFEVPTLCHVFAVISAVKFYSSCVWFLLLVMLYFSILCKYIIMNIVEFILPYISAVSARGWSVEWDVRCIMWANGTLWNSQGFLKLEVVFESIGPVLYLAHIVGHFLLPTFLPEPGWFTKLPEHTLSCKCLHGCVCEALSCSGNAIAVSRVSVWCVC